MDDQFETNRHLTEYIYLKIKGKFPPGMSRPLSSTYHFDDVMVAVLPMDLFIYERHLPDCFRMVGDRVYHDKNRINVYIHSNKYKLRFPHSRGGTLKVQTIEDLDALSDSLFSKPMLLDVEWKWRRPRSGYEPVTVEYSLVVVNTNNRYVRVQLEEGFKEARKFLKAGRKFSVEFDFTSLVVKWYASIVREMEGEGECCNCGETVGRFGRLCITNKSKYLPCFRFNNNTCPYWCLCLPCCLLTYPCYEIHRQLSYKDVYFEMTGEVVFLEEVWDSFMSKFVLEQHLQVQDIEEG